MGTLAMASLSKPMGVTVASVEEDHMQLTCVE